MEIADPNAPAVRRPGGLAFLAVLSNLIGLVTALVALLWAHSESETHLTPVDTTLVALAAICGCAAVVASIGLLRVAAEGRSLQILVSVLWLVAATVGIVYRDRTSAGLLIALLAIGALASALALFYLTREPVAELFLTAAPRSAGGGLLFVDGIIVILVVSLLYPSLRAASGRSTIKRTMADMRSIGTAVEAYATDYGGYPRAESFEELVRQISPTYLRHVPVMDGWKTPFRYESWSNDEGPARHYGVASAGKDREFEHESLRLYEAGPSSDPAGDLLFADGDFIAYYEPSPPPADPEDVLERATALYEENRFGEAIPLYRQFLRSRPDDSLAHSRLAFSLIQIERWKEAADALERAIAIDPTSYKDHNNLALVYEKLDLLDRGLQEAREAVRLRPDDAATQNTLGLLLLRSGREAEAIEPLRTAVRLDPDFAVAHLNLGRAYAGSGDMPRARAALAALERIDPGTAAELRAELDAPR